MHHITLLIIKFVTCILAFAIGLDLFFNATIVDILSFSALVTVVSYIIGDRIVLPRFGNTTASIVDFLLTYAIVWIFGNILLNSYLQIAWGSIISAAIVTVGEVFVHRSILNRLTDRETGTDRGTTYNSRLEYGTEFGEDQDFKKKK